MKTFMSHINHKWLAIVGAMAIVALVGMSSTAFAHDPSNECQAPSPCAANQPATPVEPTKMPEAMQSLDSIEVINGSGQNNAMNVDAPHRISGSDEICRMIVVRYDYQAHAKVFSEAFGGMVAEDSDTGDFFVEVPFCIRAEWSAEMSAFVEIR